MTLTTFTDGSVLYADDLNNNFSINKILSIDTSSSSLDIDTTSGTGPLSATKNKEYTFSATSSNYVKVKIIGTSLVYRYTDNPNTATYISLKIELKETGGSYSTIYDKTIASTSGNLLSSSTGTKVVTTPPEVLCTSTSGMKTNGFVIKVTLTGTVDSSDGGQASFTLSQAIFEGKQ